MFMSSQATRGDTERVPKPQEKISKVRLWARGSAVTGHVKALRDGLMVVAISAHPLPEKDLS